MRGDDPSQGAAFSYVTPEQRVPSDHPLRLIREMTNEVLRLLSGRFEELYSRVGRPSIAPERLLRALLLQLLYSIRSERMLMEQLITTCSSAGSSACRWTIPSGRLPSSPKTVTVCWRETSPASFSMKSSRWLAGGACSRTSTSPSMALCWRRGPAIRAFGARTASRRQGLVVATSAANGARTTRMPRPPILTPVCTGERTTVKPSSPIWVTS